MARKPRAGVVLFYVFVFAFLIPGAFFGIGSSLDRVVANPMAPGGLVLLVAGCPVAIGGFGLIAFGTLALWRRGGGLPISPVGPHRLVIQGVYAYCRHPIYAGTWMVYLGAAFLCRSFWNTVLMLPLFVLFFASYAHGIEEPLLQRSFGRRFVQYQACVPAFLPLPFRRPLRRIAGRLLAGVSRMINRPLIVRCGDHIFFPGYGIWCGAGVAVGLSAAVHLLLQSGVAPGAVRWIVFGLTTFCLIAMHLVWSIVEAVIESTSVVDTFRRAGFVSWGALGGILVVAGLFWALTGRTAYILLDAAFPALMLAQFFARIGCLFYGCCYGKETTSDICVTYQHPVAKAVRERIVDPTHLFPVQLFSALCGLGSFVVIYAIWSTVAVPVGLPATLGVLLYGLCRLAEEWYRAQKRVLAGVLSPSQVICLGVVVAGLAHIAVFLRRGTPFGGPWLIALRPHLSGLDVAVVSAMGVITAFVFSYHRREVGQW